MNERPSSDMLDKPSTEVSRWFKTCHPETVLCWLVMIRICVADHGRPYRCGSSVAGPTLAISILLVTGRCFIPKRYGAVLWELLGGLVSILRIFEVIEAHVGQRDR